jgi:multidrug efflux pump subunit AcrB
LGWRESGVVATAIPCTLALTLLVFYLHGYTLNRITLFALIFSIGILVDDAIVVVENIVRHFHLPHNQGHSWTEIAIGAVDEVGNPTILATLAVIAAVLPMAFVGGLMGPYMRPIPIGSSAAMFFSLAIAFIVTPWASVRILSWGRKYSRLNQRKFVPAGQAKSTSHFAHDEDFLTRLYRRFMQPLIEKRKWRNAFLAGITMLLLGAMALVGIGFVKVKMLPFDNKSEFQIILNMPEGSALERTAQCAREIAASVRSEPELTDYQIYAGVAAPFNFNGLVRHYFMRRGANIADLQINLVPKGERKAQSHAIAKRIRPRVTEIAARYGARVAVAEVPPGPPVLQTLVAEIYGPNEPCAGNQSDRHFQKNPRRRGYGLVHRSRSGQSAVRDRQGKGRVKRNQWGIDRGYASHRCRRPGDGFVACTARQRRCSDSAPTAARKSHLTRGFTGSTRPAFLKARGTTRTIARIGKGRANDGG